MLVLRYYSDRNDYCATDLGCKYNDCKKLGERFTDLIPVPSPPSV